MRIIPFPVRLLQIRLFSFCFSAATAFRRRRQQQLWGHCSPPHRHLQMEPDTPNPSPAPDAASHPGVFSSTQSPNSSPSSLFPPSNADPCRSPPSPITPQQRQRMEANRRQALARQQLRRQQRHQQQQPPLLKTTSRSTSNEKAGSTSSSTPMSLSAQQAEVLAAVSSGRSVFITGSAGTGKTFLLKHAIAALRQVHPSDCVFVTASTGVAACALGGQTIHSFAGVGLGQGSADLLLARASAKQATVKRWRRVQALVIDEVSMIDGQFFDNLEYIARSIRREGGGGGKQQQLWGGIQLLVSGDFFQLPPINAPNPAKEFAFEAVCWDATFDLQVELTHIFRQSDSGLIDLLEGIRQGRRDHLDRWRPLLNGQNSSSNILMDEGGVSGFDGVTRLYPRNEEVRKVNSERLRGLSREVVTFSALDSGREPWKGQLRQGMAADELHICIGARVMLIKNIDQAIGLVNGTTGVVTGFVKHEEEGSNGGASSPSPLPSPSSSLSGVCSPPGVVPRVLFDSGLEITVGPDKWDILEGEAVLATRRQIPLILAWALSVHKCQGMTLDCLHTDLSRAFGCGMVYVALSRVRSLEGLRLSGFDPSKIRAHPKVLNFYRNLALRKKNGPAIPHVIVLD